MARRWERIYEYYKNGNAQERLEYLKTRIDERQAKPEEIKEFNKIERVQGYLPEVENLKEGIEALENNLDVLKDEWNKRKEIQKNNRKINKEQRKLEEKAAEIEAKLADAIKEAEAANENDSDYYDKVFKRQELESELTDVRGNIQNLEEQKMDNSSLDSQFSGMDRKELKAEIQKTSGLINRCHLAAECFMNGHSKQSISIQLNKSILGQYKTEGIPLSRKEMEQRKIEKEASKTPEGREEGEVSEESSTPRVEPEPIGVINRGVDPVTVGSKRGDTTSLDETSLHSLISIEDIRNKHKALSTLAKLPLLGRLAARRLNKVVEKEYRKAKEQLKEEIIREGTESESEHTDSELEQTAVLSSRERRTKFIKELSDYDVTDIAEKGIDALEEQRKADKLTEAKEKAVLRQKYGEQNGIPNSVRLGKNYSDRSGDQAQLDARYNDDDEER